MTNTFKAGDKVRVLRGHFHLDVGSVLTVEEANEEFVYFSGRVGGGWDPDRFELVAVDRKPGEFKVGDTVRRVNGDHRGMFAGSVDEVVWVGKSFILKTFGQGHDPSMFELVTPVTPKPFPIKSVKVSQSDFHDALTAYVKDTLGIDASVTKIIADFGKAVELVLEGKAA